MMESMVKWRKSSYSGEETNCVEVGSAPELVGVRDTKDRDGAVLAFAHDQWMIFVASIQRHHF